MRSSVRAIIAKTADNLTIPEEDLELFWGLHGAVFYIEIRKLVYGEPIEIDVELAVRNTVNTFFTGVNKTDQN